MFPKLYEANEAVQHAGAIWKTDVPALPADLIYSIESISVSDSIESL
jgi:hypothetical protein